jgi:hypothetical protein
MGAVGFLLWLIIVITGKSPRGLHNFQVMCVRYSMRFYTFLYLLVDAWPSFEEPELQPGSPEPAV